MGTIVISAAGLGLPRLFGMVFEAEDRKLFNKEKCKTIIATSAGSFIALVIALNLSIKDVEEQLLLRLNSRKFHQGNLFSSFFKGITDGYILDSSLREELIDHLLTFANKDSNKYTFEMLYNDYGKELSFNTVDFDSGRVHHLGFFTTPHLLIKKAILATTAIPSLFPPEEISFCLEGKVNTLRLIDGGVSNYLDLESLDRRSPSSICNDLYYFGRKLPESYDIAFLTYVKLESERKMIRNDMFNVTRRMFHIHQLSAIEKLSRMPRVITTLRSSNFSYFDGIEEKQIKEEIANGREDIKKFLNSPDKFMDPSLKCFSF